MSNGFDAYHKWLSIPPHEQPPNHYRLLGLGLFESDPDVIQAAADRQMAHVQTYKNGPQAELSQKLLNEIAAAKLCLLKPAKKGIYDAQLRATQAGAPAAAANRSGPMRAPPVQGAIPAPPAAGEESESPRSWLGVAAVAAAASALLLVVLVGIVAIKSSRHPVPVISDSRPSELPTASLPASGLPPPSGGNAVEKTDVQPTANNSATIPAPSYPPAKAGPPGAFGNLSATPPQASAETKPISPLSPTPVAPNQPVKSTATPPAGAVGSPLQKQPVIGFNPLAKSALASVPVPKPPKSVEKPAGNSAVADAKPPGVKPRVRVAVPDAAAQAGATKLAKELFKAEIDGARNGPARADLAKLLLQKAIDDQGDAAGQYVLLQMAREQATAAGEASLALQAVDEQSQAFLVDALSLKLDTLADVSKTAVGAAQAKALADGALDTVDEALAIDNFDAAKQAAAIGLPAATKTKDRDLSRHLVARGKEVDALQTAYANISTALAMLATKPSDPEANLTVGRYRVLVKGDWDGGLPLLALGSDAALQSLAAEDLKAPDAAEDQVKIADGWWEFGQTQDGSTKDRLEARALYWYGKALPNLSGLVKLRVEKRLLEVNGRIYAKIQAAQRAKKVIFAPAVGRDSFIDVADEGGLVIGFEIGTGDFNGEQFVRSIRPIFMTAHGEVTSPMRRGGRRGDSVTVKAKDGFAVGGLTVKVSNLPQGNRVDGLTVTFMEIQGFSLNPRNAYTSDWVGGQTNGNEIRLGGSGAPLIGIWTSARNSLDAFGLVLLPETRRFTDRGEK